MPRRSTVDRCAVSDAAPLGNIRRADLRALGVADSTIARRTTSGAWVLALPGVLCLTNGTPTREQRIDAALRYAGPGAIVSGVAACRLHGLRCGPEHRPRQLHAERALVKEDLRLAHARALARPRPPIRMR